MKVGLTLSGRNLAVCIFIVLLFKSTGLFSQAVIISGRVSDNQTRLPLQFATIGIRGTHTGTASDFEGYFILEIPAQYADSILTCSYVGFKDFRMKVKDLNNNLHIKLIPDIVVLETVEIRPLTPWEYVERAMNRIPENYTSNPYMTDGYYNEFLSENDIFLKFSEAVIQTYNPVYGDTTKSSSKILQARRRDDIGQLQFMREKIEKKMKKEQGKNKDSLNADEPENIDEAILKASFGGPDQILNADPLRDTADFLKSSMNKKFRYTIEGYSTYSGENAIIIGYESKGTLDHQKILGRIYISLNTDAIMAIDYENRLVIPDILRPLIFVMGYGVTDPVIKGRVHYRLVKNTWYLNDLAIEGTVRLTKTKMFDKNDRSIFDFKQSLINSHFNFDQVNPIPVAERYDKEIPLEEQVREDPSFWSNYKAARPID